MQTDPPVRVGSDSGNNRPAVAPNESADSAHSSQVNDNAAGLVALTAEDETATPLPNDTISSDQDNNTQQSPSVIGGNRDVHEDSGVSLQNTTAPQDSVTEMGMTDATDANSVTVMLDAATQDICRICHSEGDAAHPLIQPCLCAGSLRFVHHPCLQKWILESSTRSCELCRFQFIMSSESKPFSKWRKLDMSSVERRRVICSVSFHVVALICVVWSLWVLLERTAEEVNKKNYGWAFWTKLVVVTVGFTGGVVFMYVQCKMYIRLCRRWRTYNRIIYIQDRRPPGQRFCEGSSGLESQQEPQQHDQQQVVVLTDSTNTSSPPLYKQTCCGSVGTTTTTTPNTAQSNPVTIYTVL